MRRFIAQRFSALLFAAVVLPIQDKSAWHKESYSRLAANEIVYSNAGMLVKVGGSASPLVHAFGTPLKIKSFKIQGEFKGLPKFKDVSVQGEKGFDDYALRFGLVVPGDKKMSRLQRLFAPTWVKRLYSLAPDGAGIDHIEFFTVTQNPMQVGKTRVHPLSDLIKETYFTVTTGAGTFDYSFAPREPVEAVAIWLSIDGDDTKSTYDVLITKIEIETL